MRARCVSRYALTYFFVARFTQSMYLSNISRLSRVQTSCRCSSLVAYVACFLRNACRTRLQICEISYLSKRSSFTHNTRTMFVNVIVSRDANTCACNTSFVALCASTIFVMLMFACCVSFVLFFAMMCVAFRLRVMRVVTHEFVALCIRLFKCHTHTITQRNVFVNMFFELFLIFFNLFFNYFLRVLA